MNKYLIWLLYCIVSLPVCENLIFEKLHSIPDFSLMNRSTITEYWEIAYSNVTSVALVMVVAGVINMRFSQGKDKK